MLFIISNCMVVAIFILEKVICNLADMQVYATVGRSVTLECPFRSLDTVTSWWGPPAFQRFSYDNQISGSIKNNELLAVVGNSSIGEYNLQIQNYSMHFEGLYRCTTILHDVEHVKKEYQLLTAGLNIETEPQYIECNTTGNIHIECIVIGPDIDDVVEVKWHHYINNIFIRIMNSTRIQNRLSFTIPNCGIENMGEYRCIGNGSLWTQSKSVGVPLKGRPYVTKTRQELANSSTKYSVYFLSELETTEHQWYFQAERGDRLLLGESKFELINWTTVTVDETVFGYDVKLEGYCLSLTILGDRNASGTYISYLENDVGVTEHFFDDVVISQGISGERKDIKTPCVIADNKSQKKNATEGENKYSYLLFLVGGCSIVALAPLVFLAVLIDRHCRHSRSISVSRNNRNTRYSFETEELVNIDQHTRNAVEIHEDPDYFSVLNDGYSMLNEGFEDDGDSNYQTVDTNNSYETPGDFEISNYPYDILSGIQDYAVDTNFSKRAHSYNLQNNLYLVLAEVNSSEMGNMTFNKRNKTL